MTTRLTRTARFGAGVAALAAIMAVLWLVIGAAERSVSKPR